MEEELAAQEKFNTILEWLMGLQERNPKYLQFGLLHVCFHDKEALGKAYGAQNASRMLKELTHKLRLSFRKTDLVSRDGTDIWILVPYTSPETVTEKVALLVKLASDDGLDIVYRDVAIFSIPAPETMNNLAFASAGDFLEHLKQNRHVAMHWEQATQPAPAGT